MATTKKESYDGIAGGADGEVGEGDRDDRFKEKLRSQTQQRRDVPSPPSSSASARFRSRLYGKMNEIDGSGGTSTSTTGAAEDKGERRTKSSNIEEKKEEIKARDEEAKKEVSSVHPGSDLSSPSSSASAQFDARLQKKMRDGGGGPVTASDDASEDRFSQTEEKDSRLKRKMRATAAANEEQGATNPPPITASAQFRSRLYDKMNQGEEGKKNYASHIGPIDGLSSVVVDEELDNVPGNQSALIGISIKEGKTDESNSRLKRKLAGDTAEATSAVATAETNNNDSTMDETKSSAVNPPRRRQQPSVTASGQFRSRLYDKMTQGEEGKRRASSHVHFSGGVQEIDEEASEEGGEEEEKKEKEEEEAGNGMAPRQVDEKAAFRRNTDSSKEEKVKKPDSIAHRKRLSDESRDNAFMPKYVEGSSGGEGGPAAQEQQQQQRPGIEWHDGYGGWMGDRPPPQASCDDDEESLKASIRTTESSKESAPHETEGTSDGDEYGNNSNGDIVIPSATLVVEDDEKKEHIETVDAEPLIEEKFGFMVFGRRIPITLLVVLFVAAIGLTVALVLVFSPDSDEGTVSPSIAPSDAPTNVPSVNPTSVPTSQPSSTPSSSPTDSARPSVYPSSQPSSAPTSNVEMLVRNALFSVSDIETLNDKSSPQHQALQWLLDDVQGVQAGSNDTARLRRRSLNAAAKIDDDADDGIDLPGKDEMVQRYVLAVFYYATGGPTSWDKQYQFLNHDLSECSWNDGRRSDGDLDDFLDPPKGKTSTSSDDGCRDCDVPTSTLPTPPDDDVGDGSPEETFPPTSVPVPPPNVGTLLPPPTTAPSISGVPSSSPSDVPSERPSASPSDVPSASPSASPSDVPSASPSDVPSASPSVSPSDVPSSSPTVGSFTKGFRGVKCQNGRVAIIGFEGNSLNGTIPSELSNLPHLVGISLRKNYLRGTLPDEIGDLKGLRQLLLDMNNLVGTIPSSYGMLERLEVLHLRRNELFGTVPAEFANLPEQVFLAFNDNNLTGDVGFLCGVAKSINADCDKLICPCCTNCRKDTKCPGGESLLQVELVTDEFGHETSWDIINFKTNATLTNSSAQFGDRLEGYQFYSFSECVPSNGCYTFAIHDSWGDGICCGSGQGSYSVMLDGKIVGYGREFDDADITTFGSGCQLCQENEVSLELKLLTDEYGRETSFEVIDANNDCAVIAGRQGDYFMDNAFYVEKMCLTPPQLLEFNIYDSFGDGLCCTQGDGSFEIIVNGSSVAYGGQFEKKASYGLLIEDEIDRVPLTIRDPQCGDSNFESNFEFCGGDEISIRLKIHTDNYGNETSWELFDRKDNCTVIQSHSIGYYESNNIYIETMCFAPPQNLLLTIEDSSGDGMCCSSGEGKFELIINGTTVETRSHFGNSVTYALEISEDDSDAVLLSFPDAQCGNIPSGSNIQECEVDEISLELMILTDDYGGETSLEISEIIVFNSDFNLCGPSPIRDRQAGYYQSNEIYIERLCLPTYLQKVLLVVYDSFGDGMCCRNGEGSFELIVNGTSVVQGGAFENTDAYSLDLSEGGIDVVPLGADPWSNLCG